jgi:hypothetical protein
MTSRASDRHLASWLDKRKAPFPGPFE